MVSTMSFEEEHCSGRVEDRKHQAWSTCGYWPRPWKLVKTDRLGATMLIKTQGHAQPLSGLTHKGHQKPQDSRGG